MIQKDTHTLMFIAVLLTTAKIRKQARCPSTEEWAKKKRCMDSVECCCCC